MEVGYILLNLKPGMKRDFLTNVRTVEGVKEAQLVIGPFDAVVRVEGQTIEELERLYFNKIDKIPGIAESRLHIVACARSIK